MNLCHMFLFFRDSTTGNPAFSPLGAPAVVASPFYYRTLLAGDRL